MRAVALAAGDDPAFNGDAAGFEVLLWGRLHSIVAGRSVLLLPQASGCWPDIQRVPVLEREGDPLAPIRLGPFDWPQP